MMRADFGFIDTRTSRRISFNIIRDGDVSDEQPSPPRPRTTKRARAVIYAAAEFPPLGRGGGDDVYFIIVIYPVRFRFGFYLRLRSRQRP